MAKVQAQGKTFTCQLAANLPQVLLANGDVLCTLDVPPFQKNRGRSYALPEGHRIRKCALGALHALRAPANSACVSCVPSPLGQELWQRYRKGIGTCGTCAVMVEGQV